MKKLSLCALVAASLALSFARADDKQDLHDYAVDRAGYLYDIDIEALSWRRVGQVRIPLQGGSYEAPTLCDLGASADGFLYGISADSLYLIRIEKPEESKKIGDHGLDNTYGMGMGPKGELVINTLGGDVYTIDPKTAKGKLVGPMKGGFVASGDLAMVHTRTQPNGQPEDVIVSSVKKGGVEHMVTLDLATGKATDRGECVDENGNAIGSVFGIIVRKEIVYGLTNDGDILRIDPFTAKCKVLKRTGISWWGATDYQRL
ncbi:MAG: hypothetical protein ACAI25_21320 [Planctomycetota bacterium]